MASYTHLAPEERCYIKRRLLLGESLREIARVLGRSPSTVSREVRRNSGGRGYRWKQAQRFADVRLTPPIAREAGTGSPPRMKSTGGGDSDGGEGCFFCYTIPIN